MLPSDYANFQGPMSPLLACDLIDFHLRWHEFRPLALEIMSNSTLSREQAETIGWLTALSDRVRARDIAQSPPLNPSSP